MSVLMKKKSKTERSLKNKLNYRRQKKAKLSETLNKINRLDRKAKITVVESHEGTEKGGYKKYVPFDEKKQQRGKRIQIKQNTFYNYLITEIKKNNNEIKEIKTKLHDKYNVNFREQDTKKSNDNSLYEATNYHIWETKDLLREVLKSSDIKSINGVKKSKDNILNIDSMINDVISEVDMGSNEVFCLEKNNRGKARLFVRHIADIRAEEAGLEKLNFLDTQTDIPF